jgi:hypothetical protein
LHPPLPEASRQGEQLDLMAAVGLIAISPLVTS